MEIGILNNRFTIDLSQSKAIIERALTTKNFRIVTFNPEMLIECLNNERFEIAIKHSDAIIPDGIGIVHLIKAEHNLDKNIQVNRLAGIELAWDILLECLNKNYKIALIGSTDEVLHATISKIQSIYPNFKPVFSHNGFFDEKQWENIITELQSNKPDLVLLAMPFVRQEILLAELKNKINTICMGIGGSFDVWAGKVKRSPQIMQMLGLEWFWRIINQPMRIKRFMKVFLPFLLLWIQATRAKK